MTEPGDDHVAPFDDPAHEREWLVQERAMQRERLRLDPAGDDARSQRYRLLARVLREPSAHALPVDFAQQMAARVACAPARHTTAEASFERGLTWMLGALLTVAAAVVMMIYGSTWLPSFAAVARSLDAANSRWLLALAGCLGASWLFGRSQRHHSGH
ncbi:MAG: hypothetical protein ABI300_04845 [Rhodanobacter sp.]